MNEEEARKFSEVVNTKLLRDGDSVEAVKKNLKKINTELRTEEDDINYSHNLGKIPDYVLTERIRSLEERKHIVQNVYNSQFEQLEKPWQIKMVGNIASKAPGRGETEPVRKPLAFFVAIPLTIVFYVVFFAVLGFFLAMNAIGLIAYALSGTALLTFFTVLGSAYGGDPWGVLRIWAIPFWLIYKQLYLFLGGKKGEQT